MGERELVGMGDGIEHFGLLRCRSHSRAEGPCVSQEGVCHIYFPSNLKEDILGIGIILSALYWYR